MSNPLTWIVNRIGPRRRMPAGTEDRVMPLGVLASTDLVPITAPQSVESHAERVGQLFYRYHGKLVRFLAARTHSWEEARELAAQTFEQVLTHAAPRQIEFFRAYLYRTARNLATDQVKHRAMQRRKEPVMRFEGNSAGPSPEPERVEAERREVVQQAVERLAPRLKMALTLRIYDELSDAEIVSRFAAEGVQLTGRTVRRYLACAYEQIRLEILAAESPRPETAA
jgi:RNA polymerase sigma factor (sigma-70 family)